MFEFISMLSIGGLVSMMMIAKVIVVVFGLLTAFAAVIEIVDVLLEEHIETVLIEEAGAYEKVAIATVNNIKMALEEREVEIFAEMEAIPMTSKILTPFWGEIMGVVPEKGVYYNPLVKSPWQALGEALVA